MVTARIYGCVFSEPAKKTDKYVLIENIFTLRMFAPTNLGI